MSTAIQKRSRRVRERPSRILGGGEGDRVDEQVELAVPGVRDLAEDAVDVLVGADVARSHELEPTDDASSRTFASIRSPWKVKASSAPSSARRLAIAQAIDRLLATP